MKKFIFIICLLLLACSVNAQAVHNGPFDAGAARSDMSNVTLPLVIASETMATQAYADSLAAEASLRFYFSRDADPTIAGYEQLSVVATTTQSSSIHTVNTTITLMDTYITCASCPNLIQLVAGSYQVVDWFSKTGNGEITYVFELWSRDTGGTETFIATSSTHIQDGVMAVAALVDAYFTIPAPVDLAITDRLLIKKYATRVGTAGCTSWYGNGTSGFFGVLVPPTNFLRTDMTNASTTASLAIKEITLSDKVKAAFAEITGRAIIGTSTDEGTYPLQVNGGIFMANYDTAYSASPKSNLVFSLNYNAAGDNTLVSYIQGYKANAIDGDWAGGLKFYTRKNGSGLALAMNLSPSGSVLIATTTDDLANKLQVNGAIRSYVASVSGDEKGLVDDSIFIYEYKAYKSISNAATFELPINYGKIELYAVSQGATCSIIYGPSGGTVTSQVSGGTYGLSSGASDINVFPVGALGTALQIQNSSGSTLYLYIKCFGKKPT